MVWRRDTAAASCVQTRAMGGGLDLHSRFFDWRAVRFGSNWFFGVTAGAALASSLRGSLWWLGARWSAVGGGFGRWRAAERTCVFIALWRRACCGAYPLFIARARFEFSRLAFLSPRSVVGVGRARCNSARRAAGFACVCFAVRRRACCGAYPLFIARARFVRFRLLFTSRLAFGADGVCNGTAGLGGGRHLRRSLRRQGGGRWGRRFVWADGAAARAHLGRFFLSPCGLRCTSSRHSAGRQCAYGRRCALQRG